jgi:hypothetical protein
MREPQNLAAGSDQFETAPDCDVVWELGDQPAFNVATRSEIVRLRCAYQGESGGKETGFEHFYM